MEQQARKRARPRLPVTADGAEKEFQAVAKCQAWLHTRIQHACLGQHGEEASQSGCSADSPNINASPAARPSNSGSCPNLNDAPVTGHANAEENNIGAYSSRFGASAHRSR
ncbi:hypothetical protein DCAR_0522644 [Daucus carota subsp. sativus]|uniref:Uncharacterized protein n=1 Tax=Daucus carota subsp. sativus TaxID=79200 RepID=A0A164ZX47_DAUCS|nr:hypothetical protein DCAR_0522644 [Daucus carota subsp. sativus]